MRIKCMLELDLPGDMTKAEIQDEIRMRFLHADGNQHLELMNWEPVDMALITVSPILSDPAEYSEESGEYVCVYVEDVRQKKFWFKVPESMDDIGEFWDNCVDIVVDMWRKGCLNLDDAVDCYINTNTENSLYDWKDHWKENGGTISIPNELIEI